MDRDGVTMHVKVGNQWVALETWQATQLRRQTTVNEAVGALVFLGVLFVAMAGMLWGL